MNVRLVSITVLIVSLQAAATPAQVDEGLADYTLASWTTRDGLPSNFVGALAQDAAGYLWVGTSSGLARFDGVRFITSEAIGRVGISALLVGRDGALWVGLRQGRGIGRLQGGQLRQFDGHDGLAGDAITGLVEDTDGRIWASSDSGLFRLTGDRWQAMPLSEDVAPTSVQSLRLARSGAVVAGTTKGLYHRRAGVDHFDLIDTFDDAGRGILDIAEDEHGRFWVPDSGTGFRQLGEAPPTVRPVEEARGNRVLRDHLGNLWVGTTAALLRVRPGGHASTRTGIFGGRSLFEDREGNLWVGTVEGLFRLSLRRVTVVGNIGLVSSLEATPDGSVWVVTSEGLLRYPTKTAGLRGERQFVPGGRVRAIHADPAGALWLATDTRLVRLVAGRPADIWRLDRIGSDEINALLPANDGRLWLSTRSRGLLSWRAGNLEPIPALGAARVALRGLDREGRVWFVSDSGRLGVLDRHGRVRFFGVGDGLGSGPYQVVYQDNRGRVWVGGGEGVSRFDDGRFIMLRFFNPLQSVSAIMESNDGDLWFGTSEGLAVVEREELDTAIRSPSHVTRFGVYDVSDGLAGLTGIFGLPNAVRARDGRLWFISGRGINIINPQPLKDWTKPASLTIENVSIDDRPLERTASPLRLPAGAERLQIDYGAIELSSPQKMRYRYTLEGFDAEWIEAGTRRQAVYTQLPPRRYRFHVVATNLTDPWNEATAVWDFSVAPPIYRAPWFAAVIAVTLLAGTWGFWQLRHRRSRKTFALLLAERVRMSRELHDTLLQSLVGIAWQFEAIANRLEPASPVRQQLTALRKQVQQYIHEARESIWNLRSPAVHAGDLVAALRDSCERTLDGVHDNFTFAVEGTPYPCAPNVERQLLRIGHEALLNAARHARANSIQLFLDYRPDRILMCVSDDGCGFDVDDVRQRRNGHLGLITMAERAREAGGDLSIDSVIGVGTRIAVEVPTSRSGGEVS